LAFTVDVEDYFHVSAFERVAPRADWESFPQRVEANTLRLLDLLADHATRATFFVLGWVGERHPALVRRIAKAGHEIACHSYWHRLVYHLTPDEFRADTRRARDVLEDALGAPIAAYRAPSWSITRKSLWALDILAELGFRVDSSIFPIHHDRYGIPNAPVDPYPLRMPSGATLWEFPPSIARLGPINVPIAGGGYFRLYPVSWTTASLRRLERAGRRGLFYIHPWEIDPDQPRLSAGLLTRWRHYLNLTTTAAKLDALLRQLRFDRLDRVLGPCALAATS
jgi:polysaccharide deacetylase family protein (PEP-CTERM system associated)